MTAPHTTPALHFRLSASEQQRLDALCARFPGPKTFIARRAMEIGMAVLERDPAAWARSAEEAATNEEASEDDESRTP